MTSFAGSSVMLRQAARSGFLPKALQSYNKYGMPPELVYVQYAFMIPFPYRVENFAERRGLRQHARLSCHCTVSVLTPSFIAHLRLQYTQLKRPCAPVIGSALASASWAASAAPLASYWLPVRRPNELESWLAGHGGGDYIAIAVVISAVGGVLSSLAKQANAYLETTGTDPNNEFTPD
ncbi:MAG: hypothetical protein IIT36_03680 [Aeriscardovia sp.]|nr:hypothetical protein [Aeriscardovia sp.]